MKFPPLPDHERNRLNEIVEQFRGSPVPVVVASANFRPLLENWLAHAVAAGIKRSLVIAIDEQTSHFRHPGCEVFPSSFSGAFGDVCLHRLRICAFLAERGIDFISSDLDAVWLRDPRPLCFQNAQRDLSFSQGTYHPEAAYQAWGFVLCGGFFAVRGGKRTARFLNAVLDRAWPGSDDQAPLNLTLLETGTRWASCHDGYALPFAGKSIQCFRSVLDGVNEEFGLHIGLIPHHLIQRAPTDRSGAIVLHPGSPRDPQAKIPVLREAGAWRLPSEPLQNQQKLIFTTHKSGTTLFHNIMRKLGDGLHLSVATLYGRVDAINPALDMALIAHSLLGFRLSRPVRAVRIVRDPRDIWVSSYLYHRRTNEGWCFNTNFDPRPPIRYPRVDFSMLHRPERWKRTWLARLNNRSYQQNLLDRDQADGLAFELAGYTACTLDIMRAWRPPVENLLQIKLEDIAHDFDAEMRTILIHLGFAGDALEAAMEIAATEDITRMDDAAVAANPQIHSRTLSKWQGMLSIAQVMEFERLHGDLIENLGYERAVPR